VRNRTANDLPHRPVRLADECNGPERPAAHVDVAASGGEAAATGARVGILGATCDESVGGAAAGREAVRARQITPPITHRPGSASVNNCWPSLRTMMTLSPARTTPGGPRGSTSGTAGAAQAPPAAGAPAAAAPAAAITTRDRTAPGQNSKGWWRRRGARNEGEFGMDVPPNCGEAAMRSRALLGRGPTQNIKSGRSSPRRRSTPNPIRGVAGAVVELRTAGQGAMVAA
jgi:hypothetical protein